MIAANVKIEYGGILCDGYMDPIEISRLNNQIYRPAFDSLFTTPADPNRMITLDSVVTDYIGNWNKLFKEPRLTIRAQRKKRKQQRKARKRNR